jgi:hypothetical protein
MIRHRMRPPPYPASPLLQGGVLVIPSEQLSPKHMGKLTCRSLAREAGDSPADRLPKLTKVGASMSAHAFGRFCHVSWDRRLIDSVKNHVASKIARSRADNRLANRNASNTAAEPTSVRGRHHENVRSILP